MAPENGWYDTDADTTTGPSTSRSPARTARGTGAPRLDLIALVSPDSGAPAHEGTPDIGQAHRDLFTLCCARPRSVAELAVDADLPVGAVRALLDDLLARGHIRTSEPVQLTGRPGESLLREVVDGLRAL